MSAVEIPVVGREGELQRMLAVLDRSAPGLILVEGLAASGRSALLREFLRRLQGWQVAGTPESILEVDPETTPQVVLARLESAPPGPTVVVLDGYSPSPEFGAWLSTRDDTLDGVAPHPLALRGGEPVVVVAAGTPTELAPLRPQATEVIALGPLEAGAVRRALSAAAEGAVPPLDDRELDLLAQESAVRPEALAALVRLLPLCADLGGPWDRDGGEEAPEGGTEGSRGR